MLPYCLNMFKETKNIYIYINSNAPSRRINQTLWVADGVAALIDPGTAFQKQHFSIKKKHSVNGSFRKEIQAQIFFFFMPQGVLLPSWYIPEMLLHATWRRFKSSRWALKHRKRLILPDQPARLICMCCCGTSWHFPSSGFSLDSCWWAGGPHAGA